MNTQNKGEAIVLIVCGKMGSGKSTVCKELLEQSELDGVIYDPRNEYDEESNTVFRSYKTFKKFLSEGNIESSFILIEEATPFVMSFSKDSDLLELIISVRHSRNIITFCFHDLSFPPYILRIATHICLLPTNDYAEWVEKNRPSLYKHFLKTEQFRPIWIDLNEN